MPRDGHSRVDLFPRLQAGHHLEYQVSYHSEQLIKAETPAFAPAPARGGNLDITGLIQVDILSAQPQAQRAVIKVRTTFRLLETPSDQSPTGLEGPSKQAPVEESAKKFVDFAILPNGHIEKLAGLDQLSPEHQEVWQEWLSRFLLTATLPAESLRLQQKLTSQEPERSPSPIAGLQWLRESTYADDQACRPAEIDASGQTASETEAQKCAVILTTATLKQRSKETDTTPEDYKVRELRTSGSASGKNHIVTCVSLKTGLLVRANEESTQQMDVTISKTDGSNRVRYAVNAKSQSEVLLVKQTGPSH